MGKVCEGEILMQKRYYFSITFLIGISVLLGACQVISGVIPGKVTVTPEATLTAIPPTEIPTPIPNAGLQMEAATVMNEFWSDADYEKEKQLMSVAPVNPNDPIYLQYLEDNPANISEYPQYAAVAGKLPPYNICFSNSSVDSAWREVGYIDMREQVEEYRNQGYVRNFFHYNAQGDINQQIADIQDMLNNPTKCDVLIIAAGTSQTLTPIIEKACQVMPVIQFDRYTQSDCPVVSVRPIGNYAFGIAGAQFIVDNLPEGGNLLALRSGSGVDMLEQRWGAARKIFEESTQLNIVGVEFTNTDSFSATLVVSNTLAKYGSIEALWIDSASEAATILEAFKELGTPYPKVVSGEDQEAYLEYWKTNLNIAIAPTFPVFQWRSAILAAVRFLQGETVQHEWILPQPVITTANLDQYTNNSMPPEQYAMCGCEDMTNYPAAWQNPDIFRYIDVIP
jgi:ribose transport system substrate-binding protein